jgi:hypothetical protein
MRNIKTEEQDGMLVLRTPELDGYTYLRLEDGKADTSLLDDHTCRNTFDCSIDDLKKFIKEQGY